MLSQRFFRSDAATYEGMRLHLNTAWGLPNVGTENCVLPADDFRVPGDAQGRVYLAVHSEWCEWPAVVALLPELLESGAVEEVGQDAYLAALPESPSPVS